MNRILHILIGDLPAVAAGAIVGRAATTTDTSWLGATVALLCLLAAHADLRDCASYPPCVGSSIRHLKF